MFPRWPAFRIRYRTSLSGDHAYAGRSHEPLVMVLDEYKQKRRLDISQRGDKVYIDAGQNDFADTLAAPYSIRPYHEPLVSTPLDWREIRKGLVRYAFNIDTIQDRIKKKADLWEKLTDEKIIAANNKALGKLKQ